MLVGIAIPEAEIHYPGKCITIFRRKRTGKKIFVINGNHDIRGAVSDRSIFLADFKAIYNDFGYSDALTVD